MSTPRKRVAAIGQAIWPGVACASSAPPLSPSAKSRYTESAVYMSFGSWNSLRMSLVTMPSANASAIGERRFCLRISPMGGRALRATGRCRVGGTGR